MSIHPRIQPFVDSGILTPGDLHIIELASRRYGNQPPDVLLGLAFSLRALREGHAGVDLATVAGTIDVERIRQSQRSSSPHEANTIDDGDDTATGEDDLERDVIQPDELPWPEPNQWAAATFASTMVGIPGHDAHKHRPFVRQDIDRRSLLLTRRMYCEQEWLSARVKSLATQPVPIGKQVPGLDQRLQTLFPDEPDGEGARVVRLAAENSLAIIIGGPGTGKTFSITRLLAALLESRAPGESFVVKLAAPTGKAAARMKEAIREATAPKARIPLLVTPEVRDTLLRLEASTIHRLVGMRPDGTSRFRPENPIAADVVVVDEVSMVDLALMRRLLEAIGKETRLVLLGDRDQLASVEAGCVLADLVGDGRSGSLASNVRAFTRSRRFEAAPDIALIAACLQSHDTNMDDVPADRADRLARAVDVFSGRFHASAETSPATRVTFLGVPAATSPVGVPRPSEGQLDRLAAPYVNGIDTVDESGNPVHLPGYAAMLTSQFEYGTFSEAAHDEAFQRSLLEALDRYRILAVHRHGPMGVEGLERAISQRVKAYLARQGITTSGRHWFGRPVLVTENAYDVGLMNGDVGLVLPTKQGAAAVFPDEIPGKVRVIALSRLPPHEGALAMTVHKSQGSQFDRVALVLAGRPSDIQTRELVYTGVTRAKDQFAWLGTEEELKRALDHVLERASGLRVLL